MKILRRKYRILNSMMDPEFRLKPEGIISLSQDMYALYMTAHNSAAFDLRLRNQMWIISEFTFRCLGPMPFWSEEIQIESWISEEPKVKLYQEYRLWHNGHVFAEGDCTWAALDTASRRPLAASDVLPAIETHDEVVLGTHRHRIPAKTSPAFSYVHMTNLTDKDFNYHVTNIAYARISFDCMPADYLQDHVLHEYTIKFLHETFVGQELDCQVSHTDTPDEWVYEFSQGNGPVACQARALYGAPFSTETINCITLDARKETYEEDSCN